MGGAIINTFSSGMDKCLARSLGLVVLDLSFV